MTAIGTEKIAAVHMISDNVVILTAIGTEKIAAVYTISNVIMVTAIV